MINSPEEAINQRTFVCLIKQQYYDLVWNESGTRNNLCIY